MQNTHEDKCHSDFLSRLRPSRLHKTSDATGEKLPFPLASFDEANIKNQPTKPWSFHNDIKSNSTPRMPLHQKICGIQNTYAYDKENIPYNNGSSDNVIQQKKESLPKNGLVKKLTTLKLEEGIPAFGNLINEDKNRDESPFGKRQNNLATNEKSRFASIAELVSKYSSKFPHSTIPSTSMLQTCQTDAKPTMNFLHRAPKDRIFTNAFSVEAKQSKKSSLVVDSKSASAPLKPIFMQSDKLFLHHHHEPPANSSKLTEEAPGEQHISSSTIRAYDSKPSLEKLPPILQRLQRSATALHRIFSPTGPGSCSSEESDDDDEEGKVTDISENKCSDESSDKSVFDESTSSKLDESNANRENKSTAKPTETQKEILLSHNHRDAYDIPKDWQRSDTEKKPSFQNCERNRDIIASSQNNRAVHTDVTRNPSEDVKTPSRIPPIRCNSQIIPTKGNSPISHKSVHIIPTVDQSLKANRIITVNNKNYLKLNILGKGGSSKVYLVYDEEKKQLLAVKKVSLIGAEPAIIEGYKNEINLLLKLQQCDRVVKLFDYEYCSGDKEILVVMEKGDTDLATALRSVTASEPLTPVMIKFYWSEMLKTVREIHEHGIIHSDLKPTNFLLVSGKLKLIDFGISSSVQKDRTFIIKDCQAGTINFMPPEALQDVCHQYDQKANSTGGKMIRINRKADIWSLGCILYNLVYGKTPFQHIPSMISKLQAIINPNYKIEFPPVEDTVLLNVLKSCLIRDPTKRPSIDDLLKDPYLKSDGCVSNVPMSARLSSMFHQMQQLTPRSLEKVAQYAVSLNNSRKLKDV